MEYFFQATFPGIAFPSPVTIAVIGDLSPSAVGNLGNLKAISPEEPRHALIFAIARDITAGMSDDELLPWKILATSAILIFKSVAREDDMFWLSTNARESVGAQFEVVYFSTVPPCLTNLSATPPTHVVPLSSHMVPLPLSSHRHHPRRHPAPVPQVQRVFQLAAYKTKREFTTGQPMSAPDLSSEYNSKVVISSGEAVTKDWTYAALSVFDKIFKDDVCRTLVLSVSLPTIPLLDVFRYDSHAGNPSPPPRCNALLLCCNATGRG